MLSRTRLQRIITAFLTAMVLLHTVFYWHARHLIATRYADFTAFYAAGVIVRSGMGHQLYDLTLQSTIEHGVVGRSSDIALLPFLRPAYEALAFVPFSYLPYLEAFAAWNGLSLLLLLVWIKLARNHSSALREYSVAFWTLAVMAFFPVFVTLPMGQDSVPFLLLVTVAFFKLRNTADFRAGTLLGLAAFKPQIVIPLIVILAFRPQRVRLLSGFLAGGMVVFLISAAVAGWHSTLNYPQYLWALNRQLGSGTIVPSDMPNLRGLASWAGTSGAVQIASVMASVLAIALAGWAWLRKSLDFEAAFSVSIIAALLGSYHSHIYDLALLILPISLRLDFLMKERFVRKYFMELAVIALLFFTPFYLALIGHSDASLLAIPLLLLVFLLSCKTSNQQLAISSQPSTLRL